MKVSKEIIERYHRGECNSEEQRIVEHWLDSEEAEVSFPENADLNAIGERGWKKISGRYQITPQSVVSAGKFKLPGYPMFRLLAACMILILSIAFFYYSNTNSKRDSQDQTLVYKEIKTAKGQRLTVTLSDGTVVWLNSESVMRFPENFKGRLRELELNGEAYFNIAKDASKPFIIHTKKTKVQVLGTRFNLRALTNETATSVVVEEGKVKFSGDSDKQQVILTANKRGVFDPSATVASAIKAEEVYASKYFAWKNNELLLDNLTIDEAARVLERWYNVEIEINRKELRQERYTGNFNNPSLKEVLESMGFAMKFRYQQDGKTFILY